MGMAVHPIDDSIIPPKHKGTLKCQNRRCGAEYDKDAQWVTGFYESGTGTGFIPTGRIPKGVCPVCRTPVGETKGDETLMRNI